MSQVNVYPPNLVLSAYAAGLFPMAEDRDSERLHWVDPDKRGVFPLERFHVPRGVRRRLKDDSLTVRVDSCFERVLAACGSPEAGRNETWINPTIAELYTALHHAGFAHSIEVFEQGRVDRRALRRPLGWRVLWRKHVFARTRW